MEAFTWQEIWNGLKYIITIIIGGVGYKFYKLHIDTKDGRRNFYSEEAQKLILNLKETVDSLTLRIDQLEDQKEQSHLHELEMTKKLAKAEAQVEILQNKVQILEENQSKYLALLEKYRGKYGPISIEND